MSSAIRSGMSVQDLKMLTAQREYRLMVEYWQQTSLKTNSLSPTLCPISPCSSCSSSSKGGPKSDCEDTDSLDSFSLNKPYNEKMYITPTGQMIFFMDGVVNVPENKQYL